MSKWPKSGGASGSLEAGAGWHASLEAGPQMAWSGDARSSIWIDLDQFWSFWTGSDIPRPMRGNLFSRVYTLGNKFPRVSEKMIDSEPSRNHRFHRFGRLERPREPSQTARGTRTLRTWSRGLPWLRLFRGPRRTGGTPDLGQIEVRRAVNSLLNQPPDLG